MAEAHGGRRTGAGRKPLPDGITRRLYSLAPRHVELLEQYRQHHNLSTSSAAMRHLIDSVEICWWCKGTDLDNHPECIAIGGPDACPAQGLASPA